VLILQIIERDKKMKNQQEAEAYLDSRKKQKYSL
jgi:hypothetical protein